MTEAARWIGFVVLLCAWHWLFAFGWLQSLFLAALGIVALLLLVNIALQLRDIKKRLP